MEQQFEAVLTGTDTPVNGVVTQNNGTYEFKALDETLQLTIAKDADGNWERVGGSEPYLSGWVDELAEQIQTGINYSE
ncbi:hypothetical protein ABIB62_002778 [Mucilaginibacter sp. UYP25]|uniref:hypothetical protein n=1 Tax=unclassified Mucilaginibacter TaxID=2617802 RepID=UPI003399FCB9